MSWRVLGDWGTSRLRLWRIGEESIERQDGPGIGSLPGPAEAVLVEALAPWLEKDPPNRIVLCGMVGSRGGLREVPYTDCPVSLKDWHAASSSDSLAGIPLRIAAGVALPPSSAQPDVMRGEETQVFGAMAQHPELARGKQWLLLPGTHSKWVSCDDGAIISFRTAFSGELFALLQRSTLLSGGPQETARVDPKGFADGLVQARTDQGLLFSLFPARAAQLRRAMGPDWAKGFLSGLLLGSEVRDFVREATAFRAVTLIGDPHLCVLYARALDDAGVASRVLDGDACVLAGLELIDAQS